MKRSIVGYHVDEEGDWVADLDCGHGQHVRHKPPFTLRPWVTTEAGRASKLGELLDCVRCDQAEWPDGLEQHRATPVFDQDSIPAGLRRAHSTKRGVWGRIVVLEGALRYRVPGNAEPEQVLTPDREGIVVPEVEHEVEPVGAVRFQVRFFRRP